MTTHDADTLWIAGYNRRHRDAVRDLTFYNFHIHLHLDWQTTDDWLRDEQPYLWLAWRKDRLVGALGLSIPLNDICWVRLVAVDDRESSTQVLQSLWTRAAADLREQGTQQVAILVMRDWIREQTEKLGFSFVEDIVTLRRYERDLPPQRGQKPFIRPISYADLPAIAALDHSAFQPAWQLSQQEIWQAHRISRYSSVAVVNDQIVSYQISTTHGMSAHLARLAVAPHMQGLGIGGWMLDDVLRQFMRRNVLSVTVNTQESNKRSQRLYERYFFERNGYDLPVYITDL